MRDTGTVRETARQRRAHTQSECVFVSERERKQRDRKRYSEQEADKTEQVKDLRHSVK